MLPNTAIVATRQNMYSPSIFANYGTYRNVISEASNGRFGGRRRRTVRSRRRQRSTRRSRRVGT